MGAHLIDGKFFQSDKYPTTPRGKVPLSCEDPTAQDLLWTYAQRRRSVDAEFSSDLETALLMAGYKPPCPRCSGTGYDFDPEKAGHEGACSECEGTGLFNADSPTISTSCSTGRGSRST